jgi:GR25 family glycosyltransferase involved in LPS biosynthesis
MIGYVINLARRPDRWVKMQEHWKDIKSVKLQRFNAITGNPTYIALVRSQQAIVRQAKQNNEPYVLIMEDDATHEAGFDERFPSILQWLDTHDNWDMFYGGHTYSVFTRVMDRDLKLIQGDWYTTHFIILRQSMYDRFLDWVPNGPCDVYFRTLDIVRVGTLPMISRQMPCYSDIQYGVMDYKHFFDDSDQLLMKRFEQEIQCQEHIPIISLVARPIESGADQKRVESSS